MMLCNNQLRLIIKELGFESKIFNRETGCVFRGLVHIHYNTVQTQNVYICMCGCLSGVSPACIFGQDMQLHQLILLNHLFLYDSIATVTPLKIHFENLSCIWRK